MNITNEQQPQTTQGSGSAENIGESRDAQKNQNFDLSDAEKEKVAGEIDRDKSEIADPEDLGAGSGRDDYAGGFGDGMRYESTGEPTEVPASLKDKK